MQWVHSMHIVQLTPLDCLGVLHEHAMPLKLHNFCRPLSSLEQLEGYRRLDDVVDCSAKVLLLYSRCQQYTAIRVINKTHCLLILLIYIHI